MDPTTTLHTFMFQTSLSPNSVSLVGSWDNFTARYPMERDKRRGNDQWRGCWTFKDIICDGSENRSARKRDGGLRMGSDYWYYYEIDGSEIYDSSLPSTTACPYLPGQPVNILSVPEEKNLSHERSVSLNGMQGSAQTIRPEDRFVRPRAVPPLPTTPTRAHTSPAVLLSKARNARSISPKARSPWSARTLFGLRPAASTCVVEDDVVLRRSQSRKQSPPGHRSPEFLPTSPVPLSRSSSQNSSMFAPLPLRPSESSSPTMQRYGFSSRTTSREVSPIRNSLLSSSSLLQPLTIPSDIIEEDYAVSDDEDDSNFAVRESQLEPMKGLGLSPSSSLKKPSTTTLRHAISDMKPLPMLPLQLQTVSEDGELHSAGKCSVKPALQLSMPRSHFSMETLSSGIMSPTETQMSSPPSVYESNTDDEEFNVDDFLSLGWSGYSLPMEEAGSEMTLKGRDFRNINEARQTFGPGHASPVSELKVAANDWMSELGYLGDIIHGK